MISNNSEGKPLNVLFVSHDAQPYGAQNLLLILTSWFKETGLVNPRFVLAGPGPLSDDFLRLGPVLFLDAAQREIVPEQAVRVLRSFCGNDLAAVYLNSAASGHVIELTRHLKVPQISHVHELQKSIERWVGDEKMSSLRNHTDWFIAASEPVADNLHLHHGISKEKLRVVNEFVRCTRIRSISDAEKRSCKQALGLPADARIVLGCGTTDWRKGPDLFVQVAEIVCRRNVAPVQFVWLGGETEAGEIKGLRHMANAAKVAKQLTFFGEVITPFPFMIASDIFILSSREDPFPLVCLEAADCGLPVLCFEGAGGMPHFVGSSSGVVVPHLNFRRMADEVCSLLTDHSRMHQLGEQARRKVRTQFDVSVKGQDIYEILRSACEVSKATALHSSCI